MILYKMFNSTVDENQSRTIEQNNGQQLGLPSGNGNNIEWHFIRCSSELDSTLDENQSRTVGQINGQQPGLSSGWHFIRCSILL